MALDKVILRIDPVLHMLGFMSLYQRGYFRDELDLDVTLHMFASGIDLHGDVYLQHHENEIDMSATGLTTMHLESASAGLEFKTVASRGELTESASGWVLLIGTERYESGVRQTADLVGMKVGLPGLKGDPAYGIAGKPAYPHFMMVKDLVQNGLEERDVEKFVGQPPEVFEALKDGTIEAAWLQPGLADVARDQAVGVLVKRDWDVSGRTPLGSINYSNRFINDRRDVAERLMQGFLEGVRLLHEADDPDIQRDLAAAAEEFLFIPSEILSRLPGTWSWPGVPADGRMRLDLMQAFHQENHELGLVERAPVPVDTWVDTSFTGGPARN
jgi:ABC-type nitrate/sulfonate/bicarbonate transport system substrate-binding protein